MNGTQAAQMIEDMRKSAKVSETELAKAIGISRGVYRRRVRDGSFQFVEVMVALGYLDVEASIIVGRYKVINFKK